MDRYLYMYINVTIITSYQLINLIKIYIITVRVFKSVFFQDAINFPFSLSPLSLSLPLFTPLVLICAADSSR